MTGGRYRVTGARAYRSHETGTVFEAVLEAPVEARAVRRGAIELLERFTPALVEGSYELPSGWLGDLATVGAIGSHERR